MTIGELVEKLGGKLLQGSPDLELECVSSYEQAGPDGLVFAESESAAAQAFKSDAGAERKYWAHSKAKGKNRFIWREGVMPTLLTWIVVVPVVEVIGGRAHSFSLRTTVFIGVIMLPIMLFGGYLTGSWRWKDLEKKYPE